MGRPANHKLYPYKLMKNKIYKLESQLPAEATIARVGDLLENEGVKYKVEGLSIVSTSTPIALLSLQPALYSHRNWVGLNPFTFISGVCVQCTVDKSGCTEVVIGVNRFRAFLWVAFWVVSSALVAKSVPEPEGALLFIAVSLAAWFGFVSFLGGHLIKKEIIGSLNA